MAAVLGISAHYHDAAAALLVDGVVIAAIQEERLSREKNDPRLPLRAARACLDFGGVDAQALDRVVFYENPYAKIERVLTSSLRVFPRAWRQFPRALASQLGGKLWVLDRLADALDVARDKVGFVSHHEAHAASAYLCSPFERAAVLTLDGVGEWETSSIFLGEGDTLSAREAIHYPHSLGLFYAAFTALLGFRVNEGEYKVMGLAAHGEPRFEEQVRRVLRLADDGSFEIDLPAFGHHANPDRPYGAKLLELFGPARPHGKKWDLANDDGDRRYADIAASVQSSLEAAVLGLAQRARKETGAPDLCLAGGVALNCVANRRVAREAGFERVFVQPAAGDAGGALGAALLASMQLGDARPAPMRSAALGLPISASRAAATAEALGLRLTRYDDPAPEVARRLALGRVVAVASGRFEWGPRALGQRSLLAAPTLASTRESLNRLKRREGFRPFAPAVTNEDATELFEDPPDLMTPFMTATSTVREHARRQLQAVTHVDGSARTQTVASDEAPALRAILEAMAQETGLAVVLNTSLNPAGQPICATAEDALGMLTTHGIDSLLVEDLLIEGRPR